MISSILFWVGATLIAPFVLIVVTVTSMAAVEFSLQAWREFFNLFDFEFLRKKSNK